LFGKDDDVPRYRHPRTEAPEIGGTEFEPVLGEPVMQWTLTNRAPLNDQVHIQVGTMETGYYVDHTGFGVQRYPDRHSAWEAIKGLMRQHKGDWQEIPCERAPFAALRPADGSRVLNCMGGESLWGHWGELKDKRWDRYMKAMDAGHTFRQTETHALFEGSIEAISYQDPESGAQRYAVVTNLDAGGEYRVVDYPTRELADAVYEREVYDNQDDEFPYQSSDMRDIDVDRDSDLPDGLVMLPDGGVMHEDDYEYMYGAPYRRVPITMRWPRTPALVNPGRVRGMTADPRDWGPGEARVEDVTPAAWRHEDPDLHANAVALLALADGRQLLASAHDGSAYVWSARDGELMLEAVGHSEWVLSVALLAFPDGEVMLASGGKDGLARLWSVDEGEPELEIQVHRQLPVTSLAWVCPPGEIPWLVTGCEDATVKVWNPDTQRPVAELNLGKPSLDLVWSVAATVLADGHVCVVAGTNDSMDTRVHVWDVTAQTTLHTFAVTSDNEFSQAPRVAVVTLADRSFRVGVAIGPTVRVWDGLTGDIVRTLTLPDARNSEIAMAVLPDLRVAVAATNGRRTVVWDAESGSELATAATRPVRFPYALDLAPRPEGGLLLAIGGRDEVPARLLRLDL
jgi:hypothetical protein